MEQAHLGLDFLDNLNNHEKLFAFILNYVLIFFFIYYLFFIDLRDLGVAKNKCNLFGDNF